VFSQAGDMDSLFDEAGERAAAQAAPLAVRMRPRSLDEVVGQRHLTAPGTPFRKLIDNDAPMSLVLWGPPGTGKTTLAYVVSQVTKRRFTELSAVTAGVKDVRAAVDSARQHLGMSGRQTVLFVDEVHRFSKTQQDALLPAVENRWVSFIGATTENPSFSVVSPLLSRSLLLTLRPLSDDEIRTVIDRALTDERGLNGQVTLADGVTEHLMRLEGGDARRALTYLEAAALGLPAGSVIDVETLERAVDRAMVRYDRAGDQHYDVISAFIKSIRGSDADAALHYLARMIEAGEDPRFIARRLIVHSSEDIGLADPTALQAAVAAAHAVEFVGLPEARLNLAQAVIHLCLAPKSNAVIMAFEAAAADVRAGLAGPVPAHLRDAHYAGAERLGHGQGYSYPHDDPAGVVAQQYAPDSIAGRTYYHPSRHGTEARYAERSERIREILGRTSNGSSTPTQPPAASAAPAGPPAADAADPGDPAPGKTAPGKSAAGAAAAGETVRSEAEPGETAPGETALTGARSLSDSPGPGEPGGPAATPAGPDDGQPGAQG
jgi:putative ATPase